MMTIPELEDRPCPMGCPPGQEVVLVGRDRLHALPGEFPVVRCTTCGLLRTNPRPTRSAMGLYYPESYRPHTASRREASASAWQHAVRRSLNVERLPALPPGRMLEFGCGSGKFLHWMARCGWQVEGVDASRQAAEAVRGLGHVVHVGPVEDVEGPAYPYDLVVGWMALEHVHDPVSALRNLGRWTRPGGRLVVSVPNAASYELRHFKTAWYALDVPRHLYHFTPRTCRNLLEATGWRMDRLFHQQNLNNLLASVGLGLQDSRHAKRLAGLSRLLLRYPADSRAQLVSYLFGLYPLAALLAALGQTGRMTIWATRLQN